MYQMAKCSLTGDVCEHEHNLRSAELAQKVHRLGKVWEAFWNLEILCLFYHTHTKENKLLFLTRVITQQWGTVTACVSPKWRTKIYRCSLGSQCRFLLSAGGGSVSWAGCASWTGHFTIWNKRLGWGGLPGTSMAPLRPPRGQAIVRGEVRL